MEYLLGKEVSVLIKERVKKEILTFERKPKYVILLNENDTSSVGYTNSQIRLAHEVGIDVEVISMKQDENLYLSTIEKLNNDKNIDGVLITRPLDKNIDEKKILETLSYKKDIDAINPYTLGKLFMGDNSFFAPATAEACLELLSFYNIDVTSKNVVIVGRSLSVGKPAALLFLNKNATVTITHSKTKNLIEVLKNADIVVAALGKSEFIDSSILKEDAIVLDCGIHYLKDKIVGDVKVSDKVKMISKVPGGIGIITSSLLMEHVVKSYKENNHD